MFITFCVLQAFALAFAWVGLIWLWLSQADVPEISSYPLLDFATKTRFLRDTPASRHTQSCDAGYDLLPNAMDDKSVRRRLKDERVIFVKPKQKATSRDSSRMRRASEANETDP